VLPGHVVDPVMDVEAQLHRALDRPAHARDGRRPPCPGGRSREAGTEYGPVPGLAPSQRGV
jgi:hypothetical protein